MAFDVQPILLQAVGDLASVLSHNRSKADVLEGVMALIEEAQSAVGELLAEIMELHLRRGDYQAASEAAARVPGELTSKMRATLATAAAQCGICPSHWIICVSCRLLSRDTRVRSPAPWWSQSWCSQWKRSCLAVLPLNLPACSPPLIPNIWRT